MMIFIAVSSLETVPFYTDFYEKCQLGGKYAAAVTNEEKMALPKIEHPRYKTTLPSTGKTVSYRPFTARQEKILLMAKESGKDEDILSAVHDVVNGCTEDVDVDRITIFDLEWLFVKIRSVSISNISEVAYIDQSDGKTYEFQVDLDKVDIIRPEPVDPKIKVTDDLIIQMRWPEARLYQDPTLLASQGPDAFEVLLARCIDKIYTADQEYDPSMEPDNELIEWVRDLDSKTYERASAFLDSAPRLNYVIEYKNSKDEDRRIVLSTLTDFFSFR